MISEVQRAEGDRGQGFGSGPCPACDAGSAANDLCMTHRALLERDVPEVLVKATPPKALQLRLDLGDSDA